MILWYVHDHGAGHLARARAVIPKLRSPVVVAAGPGIAAAAARHLDVPVVALPGDVPVRPLPTTGPWHHAPAAPEQRARAAALVAAVTEHRCTTAVVDVSMEVTALARLLGLRVITVRQSGRRRDPAHRIGLASADAVWVPQHRALEPLDDAADGVDGRWCFTGAFSRFDERRRATRAAYDTGPTDGGRCSSARAGPAFDERPWRRATAPAGWQVVVVGRRRAVAHRDRWPAWATSSASGRCCSGPTSSSRAPGGARWRTPSQPVAVSPSSPKPRPFARAGDPRRRARLRPASRSTSGRWPSPERLPAVLDDAMRLAPADWAPYYDGRGACRAAALIDRTHAT